MNHTTSYAPFHTFLFRTPFYSFQEFEKNIQQLEADETYWYKFLQNPILQEAIFLGTPRFYTPKFKKAVKI